MNTQQLNIISKREYPTKRVTDGLVLILPIKGTLGVQRFTTNVESDEALFIINHAEIFNINKNDTSILLYMASDWFNELGHSFFDYQYTPNLIQSSYELRQSLLQMAKHKLRDTLSEDVYESYMFKIANIIATEAKIDSEYIERQVDYSYFGVTGEILKYINDHLEKRVTLKTIADKVFISQSNISSHFYNHLGMSVKKYVDTLKLSNSIRKLLQEKINISEISELYGFSNASSYTKKFKQYFGYTPKEYRLLSKEEKHFIFDVGKKEMFNKKVIQSEVIKQLKKMNVQSNYFSIDLENMGEVNKDSIVIQVHNIEELRQLFTNKKMEYIFECNRQVILYCMIDAEIIQNALFKDRDYKFIDVILQMNVNLFFRISSNEEADIYIDNLWNNYKNHLKIQSDEARNKFNLVSYIFDIERMSLKEIYRNIIKLQRYRENMKFGIDITHLFNHPNIFKSVESQLKRIGFDYYFIDNHKLSSPYLNENYEGLLTKKVFKFSKLRKIMDMVQMEDRNYYLLNIQNDLLLNDGGMEVIESPPLLIKMFKNLKKYFSGMGIDLIQQNDNNATLYLYDKKIFRSLLGNMYERLSEKINYKINGNEYYTVIEQSNKITVFVCDWRIEERETNDIEEESVRICLNFKENQLRQPYIIFNEIINHRYGNINYLAPSYLRNKYDWSDEFINKLDEYNKPKFKLYEHDFSQEDLKLDLEYNTVHIIDIYK